MDAIRVGEPEFGETVGFPLILEALYFLPSFFYLFYLAVIFI